MAQAVSNLSILAIKRGNSDRKEPLMPKPSRARLITMKAKWYQCAIENTLVRVISKRSVAAESSRIPRQIRNISSLPAILAHGWPLILAIDDNALPGQS